MNVREFDVEGPVKPLDAVAMGEWEGRVGGVYLWCVENEMSEYLVYYVGKAVDFKKRIKTEISHFNNGDWTVHDIEFLRKGEMVLLNVAREGVVEEYKNLDYHQYISNFLESVRLFYIRIPENQDGDYNQKLVEKSIAMHLKTIPSSIMDGKESYGSLANDTEMISFDTKEYEVVGLTKVSIPCDRLT